MTAFTGTTAAFPAPAVHGEEKLLRLGVEYSFELGGGWELAPQVNVDLVDSDDVWVLGVLLGRGF